MRVNVKFFASLRELSGSESLTLDLDDEVSIAQVWSQALPDTLMPANTLAALNMEYVDLQQHVSDGDEVAFFPPVTGG